jgi:hypothetical protein
MQLRLSDNDIQGDWQITPDLVETVIPWYAAAEAEPEPAWDRRLPSLLTYGDAQVLILVDSQGMAACLHYAARPAAGTDPNRIRPLFIGLRQGTGVQQIRALFFAAAEAAFGQVASTTFRIALEPENSLFAKLLQEAGVTVAARAFDMRLRMT